MFHLHVCTIRNDVLRTSRLTTVPLSAVIASCVRHLRDLRVFITSDIGRHLSARNDNFSEDGRYIPLLYTDRSIWTCILIVLRRKLLSDLRNTVKRFDGCIQNNGGHFQHVVLYSELKHSVLFCEAEVRAYMDYPLLLLLNVCDL
jgi:hypothetical protein